MYPVCKIKNISGEIKALHEHIFQIDELFVIEDSQRDGWASNDDVLTAITEVQFQIYNETEAIEGVSDQIDYLKNIGVQPVSIKSSETVLPSKIQGFRVLDGYLYFKKGVRLTCSAGQVTSVDVKFTQNMLLCGGGCRLNDKVAEGDYVEFFIVDVDNLLGYGAGTVLAKFVETDYCWAGKNWEVLLEDAKEIPAGIYLRITYTSVGQEEVKMYGWFTMRDAAGV